MKHFLSRHHWQVLSPEWTWVFADRSFTDRRWDTNLRLFCACGKVKTKTIAHFKMSPAEVSRYVGEVYGIRLV